MKSKPKKRASIKHKKPISSALTDKTKAKDRLSAPQEPAPFPAGVIDTPFKKKVFSANGNIVTYHKY